MLLRKMDDAEFSSVLSLLESSFPPEERREGEAQEKCFENSAFSTYVVPGWNGIKALITLYDLEHFCFIEHFAVNPACRNQGLGSKVLSALRETLSSPLILEVEPPETDFARRRIAFYQRNGFVLNEYPYEQPPYSPEKPYVPLLIMSTVPLSEADFQTVKRRLYRDVYGVNSKD